jgi:competence protein ComGC
MDPNPLPKHRSMSIRRALTLIELLAILLLLALVVSVLVPARSRDSSGMHAKRLVCRSNLRSLATAMKIYANDFDEHWPVVVDIPAQGERITYTVPAGGGKGTTRSPDRTMPASSAARELSNTRAMWLLVRSGDVTPREFICPKSGDAVSNEQNIDDYYDFASPSNISYGYQVPSGPAGTRPSEYVDPRMALAADQGPYRDASVTMPPASLLATGGDFTIWRPFNSSNHASIGQNVLYGDGHTTFKRTPVVGVNRDNIYTVATGDQQPVEYMIGESPWVRSAPPYQAIGSNGLPLPTTDSVIFP